MASTVQRNMRRCRSWARAFAVLGVLALMTLPLGCGGSGGGGGGGSSSTAPAPAPVIQSFTVSPASALVGQPLTLSAVFSGGAGIIQPGGVSITSGTPVVLHADPTVSSYTLTVVGGSGADATMSTRVQVSPLPPMALVASSSIVTTGGAITVTVSIPDGATAVVQGVQGTWTNGQTVSIPANASGDTQTVSMLVTLANGLSQTIQTTVVLVPPPVVTNLTASPVTISPGGTSNLTPQFSGGNGVIDQGIGPVTSGTSYPTLPLQAGQTYTLTVTNAAGNTVSLQATVNVVPLPTISGLSASTLAPVWGAPVVLTPAFQGGTGIISGGVGPVISGQSYTTPPVTGPTTFTLTVTDSAGGAQTASVQVTPQAVVVSGLPLNPFYITTGKSTNFSVNVSGAVSGAVSWLVDGVAGGTVASGTISASGVYQAPATPGTHIIKALAPSGSSQSATVNVVPPPIILSFTVN